MTRFEFPLDRLLALRRQLVRRAEAAQAVARHERDRAVAAVAAARDAIDRHAEETASGVGRAASVLAWHASADRAERLAAALAEREASAADADRLYEEADRERARLTRDVEALETLREQRKDEWAREAAKADQERLDEIGVRRWLEARAGGEGDSVTA